MNDKIKNRERMIYIALFVALLVMLALGGTYAQGNVQDLKALRVENWINVGTDLSVGGNSSITGNESVGGTLGVTGGQSNSSWVNIVAPTAIGTATPALLVDTSGVSNILSLRKNATPVFRVDGSGNVNASGAMTVTGALNVTGAINGYKCVNGNQTVLGSATAIPATLTAAGISTPVFALEDFAQAPGNTYWNHYHTNSAGVVTFGVYQNILSGTVTPQAATTSVSMDYRICGQ